MRLRGKNSSAPRSSVLHKKRPAADALRVAGAVDHAPGNVVDAVGEFGRVEMENACGATTIPQAGEDGRDVRAEPIVLRMAYGHIVNVDHDSRSVDRNDVGLRC